MRYFDEKLFFNELENLQKLMRDAPIGHRIYAAHSIVCGAGASEKVEALMDAARYVMQLALHYEPFTFAPMADKETKDE